MLESMRSTEQSEEIEDSRLANRRLAGANYQGSLPKPEKPRVSDLRQARNGDKSGISSDTSAVSLAFPQCFPQVWKSWGRNRTERGDDPAWTRQN
jgi:hypothetical protein